MQGEQNQETIDPLLGTTIGNYTVTTKIGEGGMGSVYLAEHPLIGKKVALKVLHSEFSNNQDIVTRFFNEAKAVNDIQHPNIVDIIDYGTIPGPTGNMVYFIMEHLDGMPLENVIEQQAPIDPGRCLNICLQVADALAASHLSNIVHRDLKPDNIILIKKRTTDDFVKLLDFGIAKLTGDQPGSNRTRTGIVMGTPAYMSPEQCEGRGRIDRRTDVYALGIVLYQMLSGRVPFLGEGYGEILVQHLTQPPPMLSEILGSVPPHVEAVCMKALEKNPDARYQCMEDFMAALADPVGFVEANGGLQGFYSAELIAPQRPAINPVVRAITQDGSKANPTLYPEDDFVPQKNKTPIFIGLGVVAILGIGAAVAFRGGSEEDANSKVAKTTQETAIVPETAPLAATFDAGVATVADAASDPALPKAAAVAVSGQFFSKPSGAEVWVGGDFLGTTPFVVKEFQSNELPLIVVLKSSGYEDFQIEWEFKEGQRKQKYKFPKARLKKARRGHKKPTELVAAQSGGKTPVDKKPPADNSGGKKPVDKNAGGKKPTDTTGLMAPGGDSAGGKTTRKNVGDNTLAPDL